MASDRETLRDELSGWPIGQGYYATQVGTDEAGEMADAILASDWLRERDRRIRSVVGKEIAEAIESRYLGPDSGRLPDGRDAPDAAQRNAYDEGLELAARIAHRASREIGGGA